MSTKTNQEQHTPGPFTYANFVRIEEHKLIDGSLVYDVVINSRNCGTCRIECINEKAATAIYCAVMDGAKCNWTQLGGNIGRKKNQTDFLLGELERIQAALRAAIARAEGKE